MQLRKRGSFTIEESLSLILGVVGTIVVIILLYKLISPNFDRGVEASESYFESFKNEISAADSGNKGSFSFWQPIKEYDYYLVYFGEKVVVDGFNHRFVYLGNNVNTICICYSLKGGDPKCNDCESLDFKVVSEKSEERWVTNESTAIEITREDDSYRFLMKDEE